MKHKPKGFVATCQCGRDIGAIDLTRSEKKEAGSLLSKWLSDGCTVTPRFSGTWEAYIQPCICTKGES